MPQTTTPTPVMLYHYENDKYCLTLIASLFFFSNLCCRSLTNSPLTVFFVWYLGASLQASHSRTGANAAAYGTGGIRFALWQGAGGDPGCTFKSKPTGEVVTSASLGYKQFPSILSMFCHFFSVLEAACNRKRFYVSCHYQTNIKAGFSLKSLSSFVVSRGHY